MALDLHKNLAISAVATAPSPAASGLSLVVTAAQGARFPTPPFNATVWPASTYPDPSNAEIVRVTGITTDTLTIVRAQEGTNARTIGVGDLIAASITVKTLTDIEPLPPGTHAARPAAAAGNTGKSYYETDTGLTYISDGAAWQLAGSSGVELAVASLASDFTMTGATLKDVGAGSPPATGMQITFTVGVRPVLVEAEFTHKQTAAGVNQFVIVDGSGQDVTGTSQRNQFGRITNASDQNPMRLTKRVTTPGTYTWKLQAGAFSGGGTLTIFGAATAGQQAILRAVSG